MGLLNKHEADATVNVVISTTVYYKNLLGPEHMDDVRSSFGVWAQYCKVSVEASTIFDSTAYPSLDFCETSSDLVEDGHEPRIHRQKVESLPRDVEKRINQLLPRALAVHVAELLLLQVDDDEDDEDDGG